MKPDTSNGVCIPLGGCAMRELLKNLYRTAKAADLIEIRADSIRDFSLPLLLKQKINPAPAGVVATESRLFRGRGWVFTCYAKSNGGHFNGTEAERIKLISSAISSGRFKYVTIDIPESLKIPETAKTLINLGKRCKTKTILAYHNYRRTPDNLETIYRKISAYKPDAVKIVTYARQFSDNFKIFKLAQKVTSWHSSFCIPHCGIAHGHASLSSKLIAFCMGGKGVISRILYRKFGLFLTYASYKSGTETARGQMPFDVLKYIYRADSINQNTKIIGLLGYPIEHSRSHLLFNALFKAGGINAVYLPFAIEPRYFRRDFSLIKSFLKPAGLSITSPYKIIAMKLVDRLSKSAKEMGAINTIYRRGNKLVGINTDWIGVIESFWPLRKLLKGRQALIIGKGGASRAIIYALRHSGIKTTVFTRKPGRNTLPLGQIPRYCRGLGRDIIIINATPVGIFPGIDKSPVPKTCLKKGMIVFDTIYNPAETRLLKDAKGKGCITVNGLKMFLVQAFKQLECFTGKPV